MKGKYGEFIEHYYLFEHPFAEDFKVWHCNWENIAFSFSCKPLKAAERQSSHLGSEYTGEKYGGKIFQLYNLIPVVQTYKDDHK